MRGVRIAGTVGVGLWVAASGAVAQQHRPGGDGGFPAGLPALAQDQIREVERSVAAYSTPESARAAGFRPVLGLIPTMGVHWVSVRRVRDGHRFDPSLPDHLMFAPWGEGQRLVGVAFAYRGRPGEPRPDAFDGEADGWHEHPFLAPRGQTLTMLHVWFVPSPDGPFAGHNAFLPYWAVGLEPPPAEWLTDAERRVRVRKLALALSETVDSVSLVRLFERFGGPGFDARVRPHRDAIRAILPELAAAGQAGDMAAWDRAAESAIAQWEPIRAAYLEAVPTAWARARLAEFFDEVTDGHGSHGRHDAGEAGDLR